MNIRKLTTLINNALDVVRTPAEKISSYLTYVTAIHREGISKIKISSEIIADNANLGIETGKMPDGTDNIVNEFVYNLTEKVVDTLKDDAMVECVIPIGSIVVEAKGENAGGPVIAVGTNINNAKGYGIIR